MNLAQHIFSILMTIWGLQATSAPQAIDLLPADQ